MNREQLIKELLDKKIIIRNGLLGLIGGILIGSLIGSFFFNNKKEEPALQALRIKELFKVRL